MLTIWRSSSQPPRSPSFAFGVNGPLGFWVQRVTYLVDQNRTIKGRVKAHFSIGEHEDFIKNAIELRKAAAVGS